MVFEDRNSSKQLSATVGQTKDKLNALSESYSVSFLYSNANFLGGGKHNFLDNSLTLYDFLRISCSLYHTCICRLVTGSVRWSWTH